MRPSSPSSAPAARSSESRPAARGRCPALVAASAALIALASGCPHPAVAPHPHGAAWSRALADGTGLAAVRGLDLDDAGVVDVAITRAPTGAAQGGPVTTVSAVTAAGDPRWSWDVGAGGGPVAAAGPRVVAALAPGRDQTEILVDKRALAIRGEPGAALVGLDAATGKVVWSQAAGATGWCVIAAIDGHASGDVVAVGSFAGTLRIGDAVVTSGGGSDGFAVRLDAAGRVRWLVRVGGAGADALTAVAIGRGAAETAPIAVAGSITGEADFRGTPLVAHNPRLASQDVAVARLDAGGAPVWGRVIGGDSDDAAAGVGLLPDGAVALAATVRDVVSVDGDNLVVRGTSDTLVAVYDRAGEPAGAALVGGQDYDGARGLAIAPDGAIVVGGWFSGVLRAPAGDLTADGGDDAFVARLDRGAHVVSVEQVTGAGREEITGLAAAKTGVAVAVSHTAGVAAFGARFPAPADPMGGAAVFVAK